MRCAEGRAAREEVRSIQVVRNLSHSNLIHIDRIWSYRNYLVVTMELADTCLDGFLRAHQDRFGTPIAAQQVCEWLAQVAEALDFCNSQHHVDGQRVTIQHCDVKPNNFLLCGRTVKLSDFGLASMLTSPWKVHRHAGTPDYSAPEIFQGRLSNRSDQYALAVSYCRLRGGRLPFRETPPAFSRGYVRPAPDLTMLPPSEQPLIARALALTPENRWPSCSELIARLTAAVR
jgi:serine/threonine protein kinase